MQPKTTIEIKWDLHDTVRTVGTDGAIKIIDAIAKNSRVKLKVSVVDDQEKKPKNPTTAK